MPPPLFSEVLPDKVTFVRIAPSVPFDWIPPPLPAGALLFAKVEFVMETPPLNWPPPPPVVPLLVFPTNRELLIATVLVEKFCMPPPLPGVVLFDTMQPLIVNVAGTLGPAEAALLRPPPFAAVFPVMMELEITIVPPTL